MQSNTGEVFGGSFFGKSRGLYMWYFNAFLGGRNRIINRCFGTDSKRRKRHLPSVIRETPQWQNTINKSITAIVAIQSSTVRYFDTELPGYGGI